MVNQQESLISTCQVIASSGCHRYQYWNEQFLFNNDLTTGWATPSRKQLQDEFVLVDLGKTCIIHKVRMLSRATHQAGFPTDFLFLASVDNENWIELFSEKEFQAQAGMWHEWIFPPADARYVKLLVTGVGWRSEGKYFVYFMGLQVYEHLDCTKSTNKTTPVKLLDVTQLKHFLPDQANKFGLYGSPDMSSVLWCLEPEQEIPVHLHPNGDELCIVIEGEGYYLSAEDISDLKSYYEPNPTKIVSVPREELDERQNLISVPIRAGMVVIAPKGQVHGIRAAQYSRLLCVCVTSPVPEGGIYSVRHDGTL